MSHIWAYFQQVSIYADCSLVATVAPSNNIRRPTRCRGTGGGNPGVIGGGRLWEAGEARAGDRILKDTQGGMSRVKKFFGASTGFEPVASALALQCSTSLSYEDPYTESRPIYWVHQPVKGMKHRMKWCELREYKWNEYVTFAVNRNLSNCEIARKKVFRGFNGIRTRGPRKITQRREPIGGEGGRGGRNREYKVQEAGNSEHPAPPLPRQPEEDDTGLSRQELPSVMADRGEWDKLIKLVRVHVK